MLFKLFEWRFINNTGDQGDRNSKVDPDSFYVEKQTGLYEQFEILDKKDFNPS